ncbi:MAG: hypothetical protein JWM23_671 [Microbacteriaceae bacterium]|jgi:hypothetical protein|nr:hypothetical protein [Microbacteriaceae bacterium]
MAPLDWCSADVPLSDRPMHHAFHIHRPGRLLVLSRAARMPEQIR